MEPKFKIGDKVRATTSTARDEEFHSDLESDHRSPRSGDKEVTRKLALITEQQTLIVAHVSYSSNEYFYSTKPSVGCALEEDQIELIGTPLKVS